MEVEEAVQRLRVVRRFTAQPVPDEAVTAILNAGRRAGSSKNKQRWHFIVVRDRRRLVELSTVGDYAGHLAGAAVAIALLTPDPQRTGAPYSVMWDLGRAAQSMVITAWARGIGSVPATVYDQTRCRAILGYPDDWWCEFIFSFGYPQSEHALTRPLRAGGRRRLAEIVSNETWPDSENNN